MGKREQFIRTLLQAAFALGFHEMTVRRRDPVPSMEDRIASAERWVRARDLKMSTSDTEAWLLIFDTMQCSAPKGGTSDQQPAGR